MGTPRRYLRFGCEFVNLNPHDFVQGKPPDLLPSTALGTSPAREGGTGTTVLFPYGLTLYSSPLGGEGRANTEVRPYVKNRGGQKPPHLLFLEKT